MVRNKTQLVVILLLVTLIPMATFVFLPSQSVSGFTVSRIPVPGTITVYEDDFSTTTYLDGGSTTAEGWGTGALTSPRNFQIQSLDNYTAGYQCRSLDVQGRKVYATFYSGGASSIDILDISDPTNLFRCDDRSAAASMTASEVDGQIWYVGTEGSFLAAYNVSNPFNIPGPEDSFTIGDGRINDIEVQGHFLYVALDSPSDVLQIYDVEDPTNMVLVLSKTHSTDHLYGLEVAGDLIYLALETVGLIIWNMTTPYDDGTWLSTTNTAGESMDVLVDGNLAYVADGSAGVLVFDVSDPTDPILLGAYDTPGTARRLALHGKTLYVADYTGGLIILDVADPTHPTYVDSITYDDTWDVCLYGPYVVIGTDYGVHTISIGDGIRVPEHYGTYSGVYDILDVRVQNDIAYIAAGDSGLLTIDVSDPTNPVYLDNHTASAGRFYRKLDIQGHKAFVADYGSGGGVRIYDISDPTNLTYLGRYALTYATDVVVAGDTIFVADGTAGLFIANVSDPYSPAHITGIGGIGNITAVDVQGHYVYVVGWGGGGNGIYMYDITDISSPQLASTQAVINEHWDIFVDGGYYLGANNYFFYAANITNPYDYHLADTPSDLSWNASGVWGYGPFAIMAGGLAGTLLWNTSNIYNLSPMGSYMGATRAMAVTIAGDFAYIANRDSLHICRIYTSAGYNYVPGSTIAQSTAIDSTTEQIVSATLTQTAYIPAGTSASWFISADGGGTWEPCTPGLLHTFGVQGSSLQYRVELITARTDHSAHIYNITVSYTHTQLPSAPALTDPGTEAPAGNIVISWAASTDPDGTIDHYELQSGNNAAFTIVHATYTTPDTNYTVGAPTSGVFFFRVRAFDNDGAHSDWSNVEDITITGGLPPPIPGFPIEAIAIGALIALGGGIVYRRRKR